MKDLETTYRAADLESPDPLRRSAAYNQFLKPSGVLDAQKRLDRAWQYLRQQVRRGDRDALEIILKTTKEMAELLQGPDRRLPLRGEALRNWENLVEKNSEWPLILSSDRTAQKDELRQFNEWPLGGGTLFKIDKGGKGRRPDKADSSPSQVGKLLVCMLEGKREIVSKYTTKDFNCLVASARFRDFTCLVKLAENKGLQENALEVLRKEQRGAEDFHTKTTITQLGYDSMPTNQTWANYFQTSAEVVMLIRNLPRFKKSSAPQWVKAAVAFLESNRVHRDEYIPQAWDEEARRQGENGKGRNSHMKNKLEAGITAQAPK